MGIFGSVLNEVEVGNTNSGTAKEFKGAVIEGRRVYRAPKCTVAAYYKYTGRAKPSKITNRKWDIKVYQHEKLLGVFESFRLAQLATGLDGAKLRKIGRGIYKPKREPGPKWKGVSVILEKLK